MRIPFENICGVPVFILVLAVLAVLAPPRTRPRSPPASCGARTTARPYYGGSIRVPQLGRRRRVKPACPNCGPPQSVRYWSTESAPATPPTRRGAVEEKHLEVVHPLPTCRNGSVRVVHVHVLIRAHETCTCTTRTGTITHPSSAKDVRNGAEDLLGQFPSVMVLKSRSRRTNRTAAVAEPLRPSVRSTS